MGLYDARMAALPYANPARFSTSADGFDSLHVACPVDYFSSGVKTSLEAKLGSFTTVRTVAPVCGEVEQDVAGAAQGNWFYPGAPTYPEDPHLALIHDNFDPTLGVFSVGTQVAGIAGSAMHFTPQHAGHVNREFSEVTADATIYCYDTLTNAPANTIVLVDMPTSTTLRIEAQTAANCGGGPWAFGANAVSFER